MAGKQCRQVLVGGWVLVAALGTCTGLVRGWGGSSNSFSGGDPTEYGWTSAEEVINSPAITFDDCGRCHPSDENLVQHHGLISTAGRNCRECHEIDDKEPGSYRVRVERECRTCHHLEVHREIRHRIGGCGSCHSGTSGEIIGLHQGKNGSSGPLDSCCRCHGIPSPLIRETVARGQAGWAVTCRDCHGSTCGTAQEEKEKR